MTIYKTFAKTLAATAMIELAAHVDGEPHTHVEDPAPPTPDLTRATATWTVTSMSYTVTTLDGWMK